MIMWGNNMSTVERRVLDFFEKNIIWFLYGFITIAALVLRYQFVDWKMSDYNDYLEPWFLELKRAGGLRGLGQIIGNYNVLYLFLLALLTYIPLEPVILIKGLSVCMDLLGAILGAILCKGKNKSIGNITSAMIYGIILMLPNVFINSSVWAQCDFSYTAFLMLSIWFMFKDKFRLAVIVFGIAFAFKLQAVFFLPVLLVYYIVKKRFSILEFLWWPAMWLMTSVPALLMGRSFDSVVRIYKDQVTLYNWMTLNYPNIYCIFQKAGNEPEAYENFSTMAILLTMFILAVGCTYAVKKKMVGQKVELLGLSTWCLFTCVQVLPAMHERYGFPAEIMAVCYAFMRKDKWGFLVAFLINGSISINYIALVFNGIETPRYLLMVVNLAAYALLTYLLLKQGIGRNSSPAEAAPSEINGVPT